MNSQTCNLVTRDFVLAGLCVGITAILGSSSSAEDPKPPDNAPKIIVAMPLAAVRGETTKLKLRGLRLEQASEVKAVGTAAEIKLSAKDKVPIPANQDPKRTGDSQVEIELTLPADAPATVPLVIIAPGGESQPYTLLVDAKNAVDTEKEPNDGFQQAGTITLERPIAGVIDPAQNVDVYAFNGTAGQRVVFEVPAARQGSLLDSLLTLFDARGTILASNDDYESSRDSRLELTFPATGTYYICVSDANDQGGAAHVYRLSVKAVGQGSP